MGVGQRIKTARKMIRMTQAELAEKIGVHEVTVRTWENADKTPRIDVIYKIAEVLKVPIFSILGSVNDQATPATDNPYDDKSVQSNATLRDDAIWVPIISSEISACCGNGHNYPEDVNWEVIGSYPILPEDVLAYEWQVGKKGFAIIKADGDSMEPKIEDGDSIIFAKCPDTKVRDGDFALLKWKERLMIRGIEEEDHVIKLIPLGNL